MEEKPSRSPRSQEGQRSEFALGHLPKSRQDLLVWENAGWRMDTSGVSSWVESSHLWRMLQGLHPNTPALIPTPASTVFPALLGRHSWKEMGHWTESIFLNQASTLTCYNLRLAIIFFLGLGFPICCMGTVLFTQLCLTLCDPTDCSLPGYSLSMEFSRQESWSG